MFLFPQRLKMIRKSKELSQVELGKMIGSSRYAIVKYESGERYPDLATFETLCKKLDVSSDYLIGLSEIKNTKKYIHDLKGYPIAAIAIVETVCNLIDSNKDLEKLEIIEVILEQLNKLLK